MPYSLHKIDANMGSCPNTVRKTAQIKTVHIMTHTPKRFLRSSAMSALTACMLGISAHSAAQTAIDTETTTPLSTSSSDDTTITEDGTITLTDDTGPAITLDSNNDVTNDGAITIEASGTTTGVDNATAIILQGGADRNFTNTGSVTVSDNFAPSDTDDDALLDGPFAQGSGRTGILISGASPFEGNVTLGDGSTVTVEGNNSIAINLENTPMSLGGLTGNLLNQGTINSVGNNNRVVNVAANVTGDIENQGTINSSGEGSNAFNISGDIDGGLINSGNIANNGFRSATRPAAAAGTTGRDVFQAEDLLVAGSTIDVSGNISRGIFLDQRTSDTGTTLSTSNIQHFGSAPAIMIDGNGTPIALGTVAQITNPADPDFDEDLQFAFVNEGVLNASGLFDDFDATVFSVTEATLDGGIRNSGTLTAATFIAPVDLQDPNRGSGQARVIVLGDQAIADSINNSGVILATASEAVDVVFADVDNPIPPRSLSAIAIDISQTATTDTIVNSGTISALLLGRDGEAVAIRDSSGTLTALSNLANFPSPSAKPASGVSASFVRVHVSVPFPHLFGDAFFFLSVL